MRLIILSTVLTLLGSHLVESARPPLVEQEPPIVVITEPGPIKVELASISNVADKPNIPASVAQPHVSGDNETTIWNYLTSQGFTRNQVAGIMGNLKQEHGFKTSDERPNGLGIAQWIGNRADRLVANGNYLDINVQLNYLMEELNGSESAAGGAIRASGSVEEATRAFQNKFERCGVCMESQRIQYAYDILASH